MKWHETEEWRRFVASEEVDDAMVSSKHLFGSISRAGRVAVAADRRLLADQIRDIPLESPERSDRYPNARFEITAEEMRIAVLASLEDDL